MSIDICTVSESLVTCVVEEDNIDELLLKKWRKRESKGKHPK